MEPISSDHPPFPIHTPFLVVDHLIQVWLYWFKCEYNFNFKFYVWLCLTISHGLAECTMIRSFYRASNTSNKVWVPMYNNT